MKLYTSNFYFHKDKKISNDDYIQKYMDSDFLDLFINHKDFLILSDSSIRNLFPHFVEIELDIPEDLIFVSNFVPQYVLIDNPDHSFNYFLKFNDFSEEIANQVSLSLFKDKQTFYIHRTDFRKDFIKNILFSTEVIN